MSLVLEHCPNCAEKYYLYPWFLSWGDALKISWDPAWGGSVEKILMERAPRPNETQAL